jgi:hypothetical protein
MSGIPLPDLARIARYDILVAVLGLGALLMFVRAQQTGRGSYILACGCLLGLAGLTHIYGVFWWVVVGGLLLFMSVGSSRKRADPRLTNPPRVLVRNVFLIVGLPLCLWAMWATVLLSHWSDFIGQLRLNVSCFAGQPCFAVGQAAFYWQNLLTEHYRYHLQIALPLTHLGRWLLVLGVPLAFMSLTHPFPRSRAVKAVWLILPALVLPLLLAVFVPRKMFNYLISVAPLWAVGLAWAGTQGFGSMRWAGRAMIAFGLMGVVTQGALALSLAQRNLAYPTPLTALFTELRQILPPTGRILGPHVFWLGLAERDYRSCGLPSFLSSPEVGPPVMSFGEALETIAPRVVLLDGPNAAVLADTSTPYADERHRAWLSYLERHRARVTREWYDPGGQLRLRVYVLDESD